MCIVIPELVKLRIRPFEDDYSAYKAKPKRSFFGFIISNIVWFFNKFIDLFVPFLFKSVDFFGLTQSVEFLGLPQMLENYGFTKANSGDKLAQLKEMEGFLNSKRSWRVSRVEWINILTRLREDYSTELWDREINRLRFKMRDLSFFEMLVYNFKSIFDYFYFKDIKELQSACLAEIEFYMNWKDKGSRLSSEEWKEILRGLSLTNSKHIWLREMETLRRIFYPAFTDLEFQIIIDRFENELNKLEKLDKKGAEEKLEKLETTVFRQIFVELASYFIKENKSISIGKNKSLKIRELFFLMRDNPKLIELVRELLPQQKFFSLELENVYYSWILKQSEKYNIINIKRYWNSDLNSEFVKTGFPQIKLVDLSKYIKYLDLDEIKKSPEYNLIWILKEMENKKEKAIWNETNEIMDKVKEKSVEVLGSIEPQQQQIVVELVDEQMAKVEKKVSEVEEIEIKDKVAEVDEKEVDEKEVDEKGAEEIEIEDKVQKAINEKVEKK